MIKGGTQRVAVIGLGSMGQGMAMSLQRVTHVTGSDPNLGACGRFTEVGGSVATSAAAAAHDADVVVLAVVNAAQADAVLFGTPRQQGAVSAMRAMVW